MDELVRTVAYSIDDGKDFKACCTGERQRRDERRSVSQTEHGHDDAEEDEQDLADGVISCHLTGLDLGQRPSVPEAERVSAVDDWKRDIHDPHADVD